MNKAAERISGFTADEFVGKSCSENILTHVDGEGNNFCQGMCPLVRSIADVESTEAEFYLHHRTPGAGIGQPKQIDRRTRQGDWRG